MPDVNKLNGPVQGTRNVSKLILDPLNYALAAGERQAVSIGVPVHDIIQMLLNHIASIVSMIEPPGARAEEIKQIVSSFSSLVRQHVDARNKTSGGVYVPPGTSL